MKLYRVTIEYQALVLAESLKDAEGFADEIHRWDEPDVYAEETDGSGLPSGWTRDSNVYHAGQHNIKVSDAVALTQAQPEPERVPDVHTLPLFGDSTNA